MSETVTLRNRTRRLLVLNLPAHVVPEAATMGVTGVRDHDARPVRGPADGSAPGAGTRVVRAVKKPISGSVTLAAKGTEGSSAEVPRSALQAPEVQKAKRAGDIDIDDPDEAPATPPEKAAPAKPATDAKPAATSAAAKTE